MKKILALLFCSMFVSAAFSAQIDRSTFAPTLTMNGGLEWSIDLETAASGFINTSSFSLVVPIIGPQSYSTLPADVYGKINVKDLTLQIGGNPPALSLPRNVTAQLVFKPFYVQVFGSPDAGLKAKTEIPISAPASERVNFTSNSEYAAGTQFGISAETAPDAPFIFDIRLLSLGIPGENTANKYEVGGDIVASVIPEVMAVDFSFMITPKAGDNWTGVDTFGGLAIPFYFDVINGLSVTPAIDFAWTPAETKEFNFNISAVAKLDVTGPNLRDGKASSVKFLSALNTKQDLSFELSLSEPNEGGFIEGLGFGVSGSWLNIRTKSKNTWDIAANVGYYAKFDDFNSLSPTVAFSYGSDGNGTLTPKLVFENRNQIPNTTFRLDYSPPEWSFSDRFDLGTFKATAEISF